MNEQKKNLVSVIVPVYNVELYLETCIKSIIDQTYQEIEIILVDDGSTDSSGAICDRYAKMDRRIFVIHQENQGLSGARNAGMDICKGEYLTFIDSDDFIDREMVEVMLHAALENQVDIVLCGTVFCDQNGKYVNQKCAENIELYRKELLKQRFYNENYSVSACFKLFARHVLADISFPLNKYHEDMFVAHEILYRANSIMILDKALYWYRQVETSITHQTFSVKHLDAIEAYTNQVQFIAEKCPYLLNEAKAALAYTSCKCAERMFAAKYYNIEQEQRILAIVRANAGNLLRVKRYSMFTRAFAIGYCISPKFIRWFYMRIRR